MHQKKNKRYQSLRHRIEFGWFDKILHTWAISQIDDYSQPKLMNTSIKNPEIMNTEKFYILHTKLTIVTVLCFSPAKFITRNEIKELF